MNFRSRNVFVPIIPQNLIPKSDGVDFLPGRRPGYSYLTPLGSGGHVAYASFD